MGSVMKTPAEKLGWREGMRALLLGEMPQVAEPLGLASPPDGDVPPDLILGFVYRASEVPPLAAAAVRVYRDGARLWLAHPKKSGAIRTDITRDIGWDCLAEYGLLPVTQISLDGTWSALRFRRRHEIPRLTRKM
jgi:hypothetical protein